MMEFKAAQAPDAGTDDVQSAEGEDQGMKSRGPQRANSQILVQLHAHSDFKEINSDCQVEAFLGRPEREFQTTNVYTSL